jgi:hypothetical protein
MGLLAAMLGQGAAASVHEAGHLSSEDRAALWRRLREQLGRLGPVTDEASPNDVPGPPPPTLWNSSRAPLPDMSLVDAGMRPITGGRRPSF